jgi:hypothetical protein
MRRFGNSDAVQCLPDAQPFRHGAEPKEESTMATLPESIAVERDECRRLARDFDLLGSAGAFGAALINDAVGRAEAAVRRGEVDAMHHALDELRRVATLRCGQIRRQPMADTPASNQSLYAKHVGAH